MNFLSILTLFITISVVANARENFKTAHFLTTTHQNENTETNNRHTISGIVRDAGNGELITGASIYVKELPGVGATSDVNGFYSLSLPQGKYSLYCTFIGYATIERTITLAQNQSQSFALKESQTQLEEVIISANRNDDALKTPQAGVTKINISQMAKVPVLFGERDVLKSIQLLPGVKAEGDGASNFQVRGGTASQNLILLDDAPVNYAGHLMGFFSTFNSDALRDATLYKGQMPAQYGGRTSSVLDVKMKEGNNQKYNVNGSVGLISAKLNVEGPIQKNKSSFFIAGRRTYADMLLKISDDYKGSQLYFYDLNAKANYSFSDKDRLFVSGYLGKDNLAMKDIMTLEWGNIISSLRWYHQFSEKTISNLSFHYSDYKMNCGEDLFDNSEHYQTGIRQMDIKEDITWFPSSKHQVKTGLQSTYYQVTSFEQNLNGYTSKERRPAWGNAIWINDEWSISNRFSVTGGLRFSSFSALGGVPYYDLNEKGEIINTINPSGGKIVKTHWNIDPRLSMSYRIREDATLKLAYSRATQNIHSLSSGSLSSPFDRYAISSNILRPETADQVSLGFFKNLKNNAYELSVEGYYKSMDNVLNYRDGSPFWSSVEIERILLAGQGRSFGLEFFIKKNTGKLTGWVSYTISRTETQIDGINQNRWYNADNDRTHDASIVAMYELAPRWQLSGTWVFNTGQAMSVPSGKYDIDGTNVYYYAERNGYRAPNYHRLDLSVTHQLKPKKHWNHEISFGLFNAYNRYNPYIISFDNKGGATQYSLFGMVPSFSYNFKF